MQILYATRENRGLTYISKGVYSMDHMIKTTQQWNATSMTGYIIPSGTLCIEIVNDQDFRAKVGDGKRSYRNLPYLTHSYYQEETIFSNTESSLKHLESLIGDKVNNDTFNDAIASLQEEIANIDFSKYATVENVESLEEIVSQLNAECDDRYHELNDKIDNIDIDLSDYAKKEELHNHDNKLILDETTASFTIEYKDILDHLDIKIYTDFTGATSTTDGTSGLVPAPLKGDQNKFLRGDGTWVSIDITPPTPSGDAITYISGRDISITTVSDNVKRIDYTGIVSNYTVKRDDVWVLEKSSSNQQKESLDLLQYLDVLTLNVGFNENDTNP